MAQFQDLSTELVLDIVEKAFPEDIESLALASKCIYQLAIPRLEEHRRLRKEYTNFRNSVNYKPNHWHDPGGLLAELLCKIVDDASIGHYVKKIELGLLNTGAKEGWKPDEVFKKQVNPSKTRLRQHLKTNMDIIEEAIRAVEIIPTEEVDDWLHQIRRGNEDPVIALLLLYTPKLHTLMFEIPYDRRDSTYLLKTIQRVAGQGPAGKPYLSHFRNVELNFAEKWESLDFVKDFMSLPSLTSIKTDTLYVDGRTHEANSAFLPRSSNVNKMSFQGGCLPQSVFSELLRGVENLNAFGYSFRTLWRDMEYTPTFDCTAVISPLVANASHTLERLKLGPVDIKTSQIASLRGFRALREVTFDTSRCLLVEEDSVADFVGVLPVSINRLAFRWHEVGLVDGLGRLTAAFVGLIRESKTRLPRLRALHMSTNDQSESDALFEYLAGSDETMQINRLLSLNIQGPNGGGEIAAWADNVCTCGEDCFGNDSH